MAETVSKAGPVKAVSNVLNIGLLLEIVYTVCYLGLYLIQKPLHWLPNFPKEMTKHIYHSPAVIFLTISSALLYTGIWYFAQYTLKSNRRNGMALTILAAGFLLCCQLGTNLITNLTTRWIALKEGLDILSSHSTVTAYLSPLSIFTLFSHTLLAVGTALVWYRETYQSKEISL